MTTAFLVVMLHRLFKPDSLNSNLTKGRDYMKLKTLKTIRLILAVLVLVFPMVRSITTKGGFHFVPWVYIVELILLLALFVVHRVVRKIEMKTVE